MKRKVVSDQNIDPDELMEQKMILAPVCLLLSTQDTFALLLSIAHKPWQICLIRTRAAWIYGPSTHILFSTFSTKWQNTARQMCDFVCSTIKAGKAFMEMGIGYSI